MEALPGSRNRRTTGTPVSNRADATQLQGLVRIVSTLVNGRAAGAGMILTADGEVVTNHHVVEGATKIRVQVMSTGKTYVARVVGTDSTDDVAVLQLVGATGLSTVSTDTDGASVGDSVTVLGDANGTVKYLSATDGTVSELRRSIRTQSENGDSSARLHGLIVVDADVVSGDSGGAVLDGDGEVIGMTTAASSGAANITGYAIPIAKVVRIADTIEAGTQTSKIALGYDAFLGVELSPFPSASSGAAIAGVIDGTPAARAPMTAGDTITSVDGTAVSSGAALRRAIADHAVGDVVRVEWTTSAGVSRTATMTLARGPVA
jgi:S1-C subfamily serine protease